MENDKFWKTFKWALTGAIALLVVASTAIVLLSAKSTDTQSSTPEAAPANAQPEASTPASGENKQYNF